MTQQETHDSSFTDTVKEALKHVDDPTWLGTHSPLATPYFLGAFIEETSAVQSPAGRGIALQEALIDAADELWPGDLPHSRAALLEEVEAERREQNHSGSRYYYLLLDLRYFRRYFSPRTFPQRVKEIPNYLLVSRTRFYVHLEEAIAALSRILLRRYRPTLRLETPPQNKQLIGRDNLQAAIQEDLNHAASVAISGVGGVGKTSLGAAVSAGWPSPAVFWFTFRPGLNDDLPSLLFSLGHFFNQWTASALWLQLLATEEHNLDIAQALGFLRGDLQNCRPHTPLLCFDEVDLLQTAGKEPRKAAHIQLLEFLESLRGLAPVLFIGQRALLDTDTHYHLPALNRAQMDRLLQLHQVEISVTQAQKLHTYTQGVPRLLELYIALNHLGDAAEDLIILRRAASAEPLFHRLWKRLDEKEKFLLSRLAVFRFEVPRDSWPEYRPVMESLILRNLVKTDLGGGVSLLPMMRELVYDHILAGSRPVIHLEAARLRARYGEATSAAYHFHRAGDDQAAVEFWYAHHETELLRGQAGAARLIFNDISGENLPPRIGKRLRWIQNHLNLLEGDYQQVLAGIENYSWHMDEEITADVFQQVGKAHLILGQNEQALSRNRDSLQVLGRINHKILFNLSRIAQIYLDDRHMDAVRQVSRAATISYYFLQGYIALYISRFQEAESHFHLALEHAEQIGDEKKVGEIHQMLAFVTGRQGKIDQAEIHAEKAIHLFEHLGDRVQAEGMRAELAGMYLNVQQWDRVIAEGEPALAFFENINHMPWISSLCNNLAEACYEVGQTAKAKQYAFRVLQMEIPRSRPYACHTLGLIHQKEGDPIAAETVFLDGIKTAQMNEDPFIEAYLQRNLGRLYLAGRRQVKALPCLETAVALFSRMGLEHEVEATKEWLPNTLIA